MAKSYARFIVTNKCEHANIDEFGIFSCPFLIEKQVDIRDPLPLISSRYCNKKGIDFTCYTIEREEEKQKLMKIYIIGSLNESKAIIELAANKFKEQGYDVRHVRKQDKPILELIHDCFLHIDSWADLIVAVPKSIYPKTEFGTGTLYEIEHAKSIGKPVVIYNL